MCYQLQLAQESFALIRHSNYSRLYQCAVFHLTGQSFPTSFGIELNRWEIDHLVTWCGQNNLELNALKTVEMVVDFRKNPAPPTPITLSDAPVDSVESIRFLGTIISQDLKWELNISSLTKRAHQRMYFLRQLKKFN